MSPIKGMVQNGSVRLGEKGVLREGQRVVVIPIPSTEGPVDPTPEAEQEDVEFVRASRGRRARQLESEDRANA
jgi:hypothetical protein